MTIILPELKDWESTRIALHAYSRVISAVPRALAPAHPKWWHISLEVEPYGLRSKPFYLDRGRAVVLRLDLETHQIVLDVGGETRGWALGAGMSARELSGEIFPQLYAAGASEIPPSEHLLDEQPQTYDPEKGRAYLRAITAIDALIKIHHARIRGEKGPVQLWPHGFDIAFEWFGTRKVLYEEGGETHAYPAQLNLGWSPGEPSHPAPYFYSNPWPFEAELLVDQPLPEGARWFTESWQGSIFPYCHLAGDKDAVDRFLEYAQRVFDLASPTLSA